jgi:hypothetical protein
MSTGNKTKEEFEKDMILWYLLQGASLQVSDHVDPSRLHPVARGTLFTSVVRALATCSERGGGADSNARRRVVVMRPLTGLGSRRKATDKLTVRLALMLLKMYRQKLITPD